MNKKLIVQRYELNVSKKKYFENWAKAIETNWNQSLISLEQTQIQIVHVSMNERLSVRYKYKNVV